MPRYLAASPCNRLSGPTAVGSSAAAQESVTISGSSVKARAELNSRDLSGVSALLPRPVIRSDMRLTIPRKET